MMSKQQIIAATDVAAALSGLLKDVSYDRLFVLTDEHTARLCYPLVADALVGVIAQRLVKRLCPACKKKGRTTAKEMEILGINEPVTIARPQGCQFCNNTGYKGRVAVHELMYMNENMKAAVVSENNLEKLRKISIENGMVPLWSSCRNLVFNGSTSIQELMTLNVE